MKISIGGDHAGYQLKTVLKEHLCSLGHTVTDRGADSEASVDYPDFGHAVAADVVGGVAQFGVLVCSSGVGISIAANKVRGVRAALCMNEDIAEFSRRHNDANIACFGQKYTTADMAKKYLSIFLSTAFEGGRHARRVGKIELGC
ncbi:MAG: ribose 5-phosphate isomerase B [Puniceicoccales bacterium]|jgi:ribose 5-phosphate isomerase B|nr:ribose 5-phosphate isomerase B [Puniceicoccales bacterium]